MLRCLAQDLDSGGEVEIDEFLMGCLRLRGNARAVDVTQQKQVSTLTSEVERRLRPCESSNVQHLTVFLAGGSQAR